MIFNGLFPFAAGKDIKNLMFLQERKIISVWFLSASLCSFSTLGTERRGGAEVPPERLSCHPGLGEAMTNFQSFRSRIVLVGKTLGEQGDSLGGLRGRGEAGRQREAQN